MDNVSNANSQNRPVWERRTSRGHRSAVRGALEAHRARTSERQSRVQDRLDREQGPAGGFFPSSRPVNVMNNGPRQTQAMPAPMAQAAQMPSAPELIAVAEPQEEIAFNPMSMDEIYNDMQMSSTADNAQQIVNKEITNPEEGPVDDVPKGSYVDYMV